jgi:hypothetical protein
VALVVQRRRDRELGIRLPLVRELAEHPDESLIDPLGLVLCEAVALVGTVVVVDEAQREVFPRRTEVQIRRIEVVIGQLERIAVEIGVRAARAMPAAE